MKSIKPQFILILICLGAVLLFQLSVSAQDDTPVQAQQRPTPDFDHTLHEEALEDAGCGVCHHVFDDTQKALVYSEGEEASCTECHLDKTDDDTLALREANHASCTVCHRDLKKNKQTAGPTTCGECHRKQS